MVLFFLLLHLKKQWSIQLCPVFYQHFWQKDSFYLNEHLYKLVQYLNHSLIWNLSSYSLKSENHSRIWRSFQFYELQIYYQFNCILTGHTLNDQIETFFFNLIRGSQLLGLDSLKACQSFQLNSQKYPLNATLNTVSFFQILIKPTSFYPSKPTFFRKQYLQYRSLKKIYFQNSFLYIKTKHGLSSAQNLRLNKIRTLPFQTQKSSFFIIRPLIQSSRDQTFKWSIFLDLPSLPDFSNQYLYFRRNQIRLQFIPLIQTYLNPQIKTRLSIFKNTTLERQIYENWVVQQLNLARKSKPRSLDKGYNISTFQNKFVTSEFKLSTCEIFIISTFLIRFVD